MIRPKAFGYNNQTAASNLFQNQVTETGVALKAQLEFDNMVEKLRNARVAVHIFEDLQADLPDSVFSNNWIAHLPDKRLTLFPMCTENRRAEVRPDIVDWLVQTGKCHEVIDLRGALENKQYLEGTGSIVFDYRTKVAYACESPRTNIALFELYCRRIGYKPVSFASVDLDGKPIYHTNVMMTLGDKFALVCLDSVADPVECKMLEIKLSESGRTVIPISWQQMNHFAGNCIEVLDRTNAPLLLMSKKAFSVLTADQKKQLEMYVAIHAFEIPVIETIGGGSVRCMITGIFT
ncbi:MAG: amidinotransferase [Bacteroidetes bacterium]|nr:amidinotransferase [Bacteroidota bacterium]